MVKAEEIKKMLGNLNRNIDEIEKNKRKKVNIESMRDKIIPSNVIGVDDSVKVQAEMQKLEILIRTAEQNERKLVEEIRVAEKTSNEVRNEWSGVYGLETVVERKISSLLGKGQISKFRDLIARISLETIDGYIDSHGKNGTISFETLSVGIRRELNISYNYGNPLKRAVRRVILSSDRYVVSVNPYTVWDVSSIPVELREKGYVPFDSKLYIIKKWTEDRLGKNFDPPISFAELHYRFLSGDRKEIPEKKLLKVTRDELPKYAKFMFGAGWKYDNKSKQFVYIGRAQLV